MVIDVFFSHYKEDNCDRKERKGTLFKCLVYFALEDYLGTL